MNETRPRIFIVDDDEPFNKSLARLLKSGGFDVETFLSAQEFLEREAYHEPCCLLLDVRMPGLTGPDLQRELAERDESLPIVFLTAHGDVPTGVNAMKLGALDFLLKPVAENDLFEAVDRALNEDAQIKSKKREIREAIDLVESLTSRELEVFRWIIAGMLNKQIAAELGITERTIKAHRAQIMQKLDVVSVAQLVRIAEKADIFPAKDNPYP
ncbi:response regulator transcription factor, partial [Candidatus Sumerlaeota bacterium]